MVGRVGDECGIDPGSREAVHARLAHGNEGVERAQYRPSYEGDSWSIRIAAVGVRLVKVRKGIGGNGVVEPISDGVDNQSTSVRCAK